MIQLRNCPVCGSEALRPHISLPSPLPGENKIFRFEQCKDCRVVFLNPRPDIKELKPYYSAHYLPYQGPEAWGKYAKFVRKSERALDQRRLKELRNLHPKPSFTLLDVGCGKPSFIQRVKQDHPDAQCIGLDFEDSGWLANEYSDLRLIKGTLESLDEDVRPNITTMWHYLEHVHDPIETLQIARDRSAEDGQILVEVPNFASDSRSIYNDSWGGYHVPRHMTLFSPENMRFAMEKAGWKDVQIRTRGTLHPYILYWLSEVSEEKLIGESLEDEFIPFVKGLIRFLPKYLKRNQWSLGVMLASGRR